jgi:hypothetical protein
VVAVSACALVVRVLYWVLVTPSWVPKSDANAYLDLARNLAAGHGYASVYPQLGLHATAFRPPLYPFLLAVPTWLFGPDALWAARALSLAFGVGVVALTVVFVHRVSTLRAAAVAGAAVALYPPLLANDTVTLTEPLSLLLLLAVLITLDRRQPLLCGAFTGLLILTRPNAYLVLAIAAVVLLRWAGWRKAVAMIGMAAVVVVPLMIRNQVQVGTLRVATSDGFTMSAVYGPEGRAQGEFVDPVLDPAYDGTEVEYLGLQSEPEWSTELARIAIEGVVDEPGYVLEVIRRNTLAHFELRPSVNELPESLDGRNHRLRTAALPLFFAVTAVGLAGLWLTRRERRLWPALAIVGQFVVLALVLVPPPRLRAPFDLLMCIGVGLFVERVADRRRTARLPRP